MQTSKKFAFDVGITFIASTITIFLGVIIGVVLARYIGAEGLGLYRMTSTIYGFGMLFAGFGIEVAVVKYVAQNIEYREKSNKIVTSAIITSLFIGIGFSMVFYLSGGLFEGIFNMPGLSKLLKILSPVFPFALVNGVFLGLLNGRREMKKFSIATIIQSVLMMVISVFLVYQGFGVSGVVIGVVLSSVGSFLFLLWISRDYFNIVLEGYIQTTKKLLKFGAQIFGINALNIINYQADIIMIGYFLTAFEVGYYGVAANFSKLFWIIPQAIQKITYPATSEYVGMKNYPALQIMIDKSMKYTACFLLPMGLLIMFFGEYIITTIYGDEFNFSVTPLLILIIGTVIYGLVISIGGSIIGAGRPDLGLKLVGFSSVTNIVLNLLLIPHFGIVGAAIATMASLLVNTIVSIFVIIKILKVKIDFKWFTKIFVITLLSIFLFEYFGHINIYLIGISIMSIYIIVILMLFLTKEDWKYFNQLLH